MEPLLHSPVGPSALPIIRWCAGTVAMSYPFRDEPETEEAREGHAAHWVAFELLRHGVVHGVGETAPNGVIVTDEMVDGAELYCAVVNEARGEIEVIEETLQIPRIHAQCFGTPDYAGYSPTWQQLRVVDYKFGHRYVEVVENEQLTAYADGFMRAHLLDMVPVDMEFIIVQPRYYRGDPVRRWKTNAATLRPLLDELHLQATLALRPGAPCKTGTHCGDCKGRRACATLANAGGLMIDLVGSLEAITQSPEVVGSELRIIDAAIDRLESLRTARAEQALGFLRSGLRVPYYEVAFSQPRDIWTRPVAEIKALGQLLDVELTEEKPCTPKQAMAKLKKKDIDGSVIKNYSSSPPGAAKVVPASLTDAQKTFGAT